VATVRRADLILVMADGRIIQRGKHIELLDQGGLYKEIYDLQLNQQNRYLDEKELEENILSPQSELDALKGRRSSDRTLS